MADSSTPLGKLRDAAERALKRLPVIGGPAARTVRAGVRATMAELAGDPARERKAALINLVPRRCGLCAHFSLEVGQRDFGESADFFKAMGVLKPSQMGSSHDTPAKPISPAALELRPNLTEEWKDYGRCGKHFRYLWGFEEAPRFQVKQDFVDAINEFGEPEKKLVIELGPPCADWE